jgi:AraC family transcriptional regulator of adaptative response / DNA-3-methyladenine glycosylase II
MERQGRRYYQALCARDRRFDGVFFVAVTSTGIYCRPICPANTPRERNCRFFEGAHEAEQAGFRPCLRCRPELAPGSAPVDDAQRIASLIVQRLEEGAVGTTRGLDAIADQFELSSRQLRRIVRKELGVSPVQLLLTRRLLLAKQLLTETPLPVTDIAFASGFSSLRRFNDAFRGRYRMPPTRLRRKVLEGEAEVAVANNTTSTLQMSYRPPYDWNGVIAFLSARALPGVEWVSAEAYARTVRIGSATGWIRVAPAARGHALTLEFTHGLTPVLPVLLRRMRALFDLDARPDLISGHLQRDRHLAHEVTRHPGTRVPGAFDGFEIGVRAILGQQITVAGATTIAGRFVDAFGEPIATPFPHLQRVTPSAATVASAGADRIARLGIVGVRAKGISALANAEAAGLLRLEGGLAATPEEALQRVIRLPGIGPWTAQYIAMRVFRSPDAFPKEDLVVRRTFGGVSAREVEAVSQAWRPWRSYAVMHVWRMASGSSSGRRSGVPTS